MGIQFCILQNNNLPKELHGLLIEFLTIHTGGRATGKGEVDIGALVGKRALAARAAELRIGSSVGVACDGEAAGEADGAGKVIIDAYRGGGRSGCSSCGAGDASSLRLAERQVTWCCIADCMCVVGGVQHTTRGDGLMHREQLRTTACVAGVCPCKRVHVGGSRWWIYKRDNVLAIEVDTVDALVASLLRSLPSSLDSS